MKALAFYALSQASLGEAVELGAHPRLGWAALGNEAGISEASA